MNRQEELAGIIDHIIYTSQDNGFTVFVLQCDNQSITATGSFAALNPGEHITVCGHWTTHAKFGRQFNVEKWHITQPTTIVGIKKYLGSGLIKGIGPVYAEKLVNHFGTTVLTIIDKEPARLAQVPGIGPKRVEKIIAAWQDQKEISHLMVFFTRKKCFAPLCDQNL